MKKSIAMKWADLLESGEFKQTTEYILATLRKKTVNAIKYPIEMKNKDGKIRRVHNASDWFFLRGLGFE